MVTVCFYANNTVASLLIRLWTWKWFQGQTFADVPSHVAVLVADPDREDIAIVCESLFHLGVCTRSFDYRDAKVIGAGRSFYFDDESDRIANFVTSQLGDKYDYLALFADVICRFVPFMRWRVENEARWTCSRLAAHALKSAAVDIPDLRYPYAPNDLLRRLRRLHHAQ